MEPRPIAIGRPETNRTPPSNGETPEDLTRLRTPRRRPPRRPDKPDAYTLHLERQLSTLRDALSSARDEALSTRIAIDNGERVDEQAASAFNAFIERSQAKLRVAALENARLHQVADDAVRARDEFLSIASHELRTPLTPLRILFQRMLDDKGQVRPAATQLELLQPVLQRGERQVRRLEGLIDNLFDVSRITSGTISLQLAPVDLRELVREVVARSAEELTAAGCAVTLEAEVPLWGCWDRRRLEQVATNLVSNAIKYGSGKPILIRVEAVGRNARLAILDHGLGIAASDLEGIFQRFHRAASSPSSGGLGLGLYLSKQIVDAHGGAIAVDSTPGVGTELVVDLPLGTGEPRAGS